MLSKRNFLSAVAALACTALNAGRAAAQAYPNRPVKIVIPFGPGGPTEFILRLIADRLTTALGQAFIIENRPGGAGGTVGAKSVAVAEPDGYTLLFSSPGPLVTAAAIYKNLDYDPIRSFAPIAMVIYAPQMLAVHPSMPVNSLPELVAYAKANPGKVAFGSSGHGTQPHLLGEMLKVMAGVDIVHVPYRGAGRSVTDVVAGQVQMIFETTAILLPHIESGKLRALAVAAEARSPLLPGVPTTAENGYPELTASFWSGVLAPAGTPAAIVAKLNGAINEILKSKEAQDGLARLSAEARIGSPQDFAAFIASETPRWAAIANETGVKVD
ncbi:MAG TPA: tripartite tricarboxylate transporter substrate binding protein [Xanthobacteraceae bacterium]|nr:tripartite tricarboxylate transporter substrate binding protein [Xanthobacteraceae bacterium]